MQLVLGDDVDDFTTLDSLASTTASGEQLFTRPFGAATTWLRKDEGSLTLKYVFDPMQGFDQVSLSAPQ